MRRAAHIKCIWMFLIICLVFANVDAQSEKELINNKLKKELHLFKLAKVWGIAKYRHPKIGDSTINWDEALKELIPLTTQNDFDNKLYDWLILNIPTNGCKKRVFQKQDTLDILVESNYDWLNDRTLFSDQLIEYLNVLIDLEPVSLDKHQYITNGKWGVTPVFKEERFRESKVWDSEYLKILTLFRYWNIIEYFHPYKYLNTYDWNAVLREFIPRFLKSHTELSYKLMLMELCTKIQDSHSGIYETVTDEYFGINQVPFELKLLNGEVLIKDIFKTFQNITKLKLGDVVTHLDEIPINLLIERNRETIVASNTYAFEREITQRLIRTSKDSLKVSVLRDGQVIKTHISTIPYKFENYIFKKVPSYKIMDDNIGYLYPGSLESNEQLKKILDTLKNTKAIILDYRCYPTPSVLLQFIVPEFLFSKPQVYYKSTHFDWNTLGQFYYKEPVLVGKENPNYYKGKFIVLLDEFSSSQPEFEALAYKKGPNTLFIGTNSGGTIGNMTSIFLPGNIWTMMSGCEVRDVDGTQIQKIGIVPDVLVKITKQGITEGRDEILEAAINVIEKEK